MKRSEARELTDEIVSMATNLAELVIQAFDERAWEALGYRTWAGYCKEEFPFGFIKLVKDDRIAVGNALAERDLSSRAIAETLGVSERQVRRDRESGAANAAPASKRLGNKGFSFGGPRVTGKDGKSYPAQRKPKIDPDARLHPSTRPKTGCSSDDWNSGMSFLRTGLDTMMVNPTVGQVLQLEKFLQRALHKVTVKRAALERHLSVVE
jgi:hypothetical protein